MVSLFVLKRNARGTGTLTLSATTAVTTAQAVALRIFRGFASDRPFPADGRSGEAHADARPPQQQLQQLTTAAEAESQQQYSAATTTTTTTTTTHDNTLQPTTTARHDTVSPNYQTTTPRPNNSIVSSNKARVVHGTDLHLKHIATTQQHHYCIAHHNNTTSQQKRDPTI